MLNTDIIKDLEQKDRKEVQTLLDLSTNYIFFKDRYLRYVMVNKKFAAFYNKPADFFIGKTDEDF